MNLALLHVTDFKTNYLFAIWLLNCTHKHILNFDNQEKMKHSDKSCQPQLLSLCILRVDLNFEIFLGILRHFYFFKAFH